MFNITFMKKKNFTFSDPTDAKLYKLPILLVWDRYYIDEDGTYHYAVAKEGHWIRFIFDVIRYEIKNFRHQ